ncbi:MAG: hypothetical protein KatS3mg031_2068 [Chitinophagales bacterium]|nr:MAG: hypothetical protein KatS3mg031_2068 [Chitinophagales bacterium]
MPIVVNEDSLIGAVQEAFQEQFPFLKIEFCPLELSASNEISRTNSFGQYNGFRTGSIVIDSSTTVADLDRAFRKIFGLSARIYRKSGKAWLEIKLTGSWTLQEQNDQGKALSV